jgi:hypothetical protein
METRQSVSVWGYDPRYNRVEFLDDQSDSLGVVEVRLANRAIATQAAPRAIGDNEARSDLQRSWILRWVGNTAMSFRRLLFGERMSR